MADKATTEKFELYVVDLVKSGQTFTASDVVIGARARGIDVRHNESRDIIHDLHRRGVLGPAYSRTTVPLTDSTRPFVYHPTNINPSEYRSSFTDVSSSLRSGHRSQPKRGFLGRLIQSLFGGGDDESKSGRKQRSGDQPAPADLSSNPSVPPKSSRRMPQRRKNVTLDLDAKSFLPIDRDELLSSAKKVNLWASPWFGRRDLIPPLDDPRTNLIDRGMVAEGLLTSDELRRIHEVGAEMDFYRPDDLLLRHQAQRSASGAIEAQRQASAERKALKKAEAAERRQQREKEIQYRRANQIDYLGRRVSTQLHLCQSDADKLQAVNLPVLHTTKDLADAMGIEISRLRWLAFHEDVASRIHYVSFSIPKRSGGTRTLSAPLPRLAAAQRWIYAQILRDLPVGDCVHGFVPGRGIVSGAQPHIGQEVLLNMDLEDFFPTIGFARVRHAFHWLGYSPAVSTVLALLCTEAPRREVSYQGTAYQVATGPRVLPQGACTSPAISNLVTERLDRRVIGFANKFGLTYTRYADDMTLSGGTDFAGQIGYAIAKIRHIAEEEGFRVKTSKTRVLRRNAAQRVTSLVVNDKAGVGRRKLRQVRAILHNASKTGLQAQNRDNHPNYRASLEGMIAYIAMTRPDQAATMRAKLDAIAD
ncbi:reverse transcriptase family protein [Stieleria sp. JC731]|uniref:reverse transcriptase family protein n=1 Tax=Pirellulaceae TaxID=2691357 RepID=UPI001E3F33CC|nr:reverse transcriptase family protein [Stieleria sp. JC731]MCC9600189.1 reverse transcriptase family protein [Stieleria sp. JC731]